MSLYNTYDSFYSNNPSPSVLGGRNRARTAKRLQGKFLPNDEFLASLVTPDPQHGRKGGLALLEKRGREYFRDIAKRRKRNLKTNCAS